MADDAQRPPESEPAAPRDPIRAAARAFLALVRPSDPRPDIPFVPMPPAVRALVAERIGLGPADRLVDVGCGDGRTLIDLAGRAGCRAVGLERDPALVERARAAIDAAGLADRVTVIEGDFGDGAALDALGLGEATAVLLFLYPWAVGELVPRLVARLPDAARIVSYTFASDHFAEGERRMVPGYAYPGHRVPLYVWSAAELRDAIGDATADASNDD